MCPRYLALFPLSSSSCLTPNHYVVSRSSLPPYHHLVSCLAVSQPWHVSLTLKGWVLCFTLFESLPGSDFNLPSEHCSPAPDSLTLIPSHSVKQQSPSHSAKEKSLIQGADSQSQSLSQEVNSHSLSQAVVKEHTLSHSVKQRSLSHSVKQ